MPERINVHVRVSREVWESFQAFVVETHGQKYGNLGREAENALNEYIDKDRLTRVEENTEELLARLDELDAAHTHTPSESAVKVTRIADHLRSLDRTVIPGDDVRRAIEDVAGADDRTVEKYEEQLKRRAAAYEHPTDNVWFVDRSEWIRVVESYIDNNPTAGIHDVLAPYPMGYDEYEREVERGVVA